MSSTFNIYLPVTDKLVSQPHRKDKELLRGSEVILLVDDEEMILEIGKDLLAKLGYQVITAPNGKKALAIYQRDQNKIGPQIVHFRQSKRI